MRGMVCNGYEQLFKNSLKTAEHQNVRKRIHEFSDFLVNVLRVRRIEGAKLAGIATYHDSCSALRECNIRQEPRILLEQVEGLELVEMEETDQCCGFGGTFAAKFEAISVSMTEVKIDHMLAVKPDFSYQPTAVVFFSTRPL
jgi:L-lactate dehydrogenase complex protein LldE